MVLLFVLQGVEVPKETAMQLYNLEHLELVRDPLTKWEQMWRCCLTAGTGRAKRDSNAAVQLGPS